MSQYGLDKVLLDFLRANMGSEFQVEALQEQLGPSLRVDLINLALGRLNKRNLVSRRISSEGKNKRHYWMLRTKPIKTEEDIKNGSRQKV